MQTNLTQLPAHTLLHPSENQVKDVDFIEFCHFTWKIMNIFG